MLTGTAVSDAVTFAVSDAVTFAESDVVPVTVPGVRKPSNQTLTPAAQININITLAGMKMYLIQSILC